MKKLALIKLRSNINCSGAVKDTMKMMYLTRVHHCSIVDDRDSYKKMLQKVKDFTTWGEIDEETFEKMLLKRGRLPGDKRVTDDYIAKNSSYKSAKEFAKAFISFEAELSDIKGLKKVFRLTPPSKGFKSTKKSYANRGDLGYRGAHINELIVRMI